MLLSPAALFVLILCYMYVNISKLSMLHMYILAWVVVRLLKPYTPYSARMSPENTHKLMGFYMEV